MTVPGEVSYPVKTEYGYHIIKVVRHHRSLTVDLARLSILETLKQLHQAEIFNNYRENLFERYHVQFPGKLHPVHLKPRSLRN